jgi:hypothetical protein
MQKMGGLCPIIHKTRNSKNAKNSNNRNWGLDSNRAKLNPAAG